MHPTTDRPTSQERTMQDGPTPTPRATSLLTFQGITMVLIELQGVEYIQLKPLSELACIDWRNTKKAIQGEDQSVLFGPKWISPPVLDGVGGASTPLRDALYIRFDRAHLFLARISTAQMRAQGNVAAADHLLALQIEWAGVLHRYETQGFAAKSGRVAVLRDLLHTAKIRDGIKDPRERLAFTARLHEEMRDAGLPVESVLPPQPQLPLNA
ncbi:hypothetical protein MOQ21_10615 [Stenotrophomonas maltophilia]|nr:hypothetical protein [Stenotrophomonas maltophilia]MCI1128272.1 hypothetical protein [Stenotrophomonas maltophilia]